MAGIKVHNRMKIISAQLWFLPVTMRMPLKFGSQVMDRVVCARTRVTLEDANGNLAQGWGETPLSVAWVWPSSLDYWEREEALKAFCRRISQALPSAGLSGHPMEMGYDFMEGPLPDLLAALNAGRDREAAMPYLAALVCFSLFDIAIHDAFAVGKRSVRLRYLFPGLDEPGSGPLF